MSAIAKEIATLQSERDDLLAALRKLEDFVTVFYGYSSLLDEPRALIARCDERDARGKKTRR